jgi:hypothetical protein
VGYLTFPFAFNSNRRVVIPAAQKMRKYSSYLNTKQLERNRIRLVAVVNFLRASEMAHGTCVS